MSDVSLVMGASGFLGSHVTRQLVERGDEVRVWTRPSSSTVAFADLPVDRRQGELLDEGALCDAMSGVGTVYYCIVDTRVWLLDQSRLFQTNVEGLRHVLKAAVKMEVPRFVFCSTVGTIAVVESGLATEDMPHNWAHLGGGYIKSRVAAEDLVLQYHRDHGLSAVVMCVSTTYGPGDYGPSPHGLVVRAAVHGKLPVYVRKVAMEVVGIEDAAQAFLLAAERGRPGERYIVSESFMASRDVLALAAGSVGEKPPRIGIPLAVMWTIGAALELLGRLRRRAFPLNRISVRLMHYMSPLDHSKATRELGWEPRPTEEAIEKAARFFLDRRD